MHGIKAISLDLDDTLWDIEPVIRNAEAALWRWLDEHYPRISERWPADDLVRLRLDLAQQNPHKAHDFRYLRKLTLRTVALEAGYTEALVEPAFAVFDTVRNQVEFFPDVLPELKFLAKDFVLVAVTNGNANLHTIGIADYFAGIVTSVAVGAAKPAKAMFDEAIRISGVRADEVLHVGDHPETDMHGARSAGMKTAWMNRKHHEWPQEFALPDVTVRSISDVRRLLRPALRDRKSESLG